jgi:hypothetical protein
MRDHPGYLVDLRMELTFLGDLVSLFHCPDLLEHPKLLLLPLDALLVETLTIVHKVTGRL